MTVAYIHDWNPDTGTFYPQRITITQAENERFFNGSFKPGKNYGNAYTGHCVSIAVFGIPEYEKARRRILVHNAMQNEQRVLYPVFQIFGSLFWYGLSGMF